MVLPGTYTVSVEEKINGKVTSICPAKKFEVVSAFKQSLPVARSKETLEFYKNAAKLIRSIRRAAGRTDEVLSQLAQIKKALAKSAVATENFIAETRSLTLKLTDLRELLAGRHLKAKYSEPAPISILSRANGAMSAKGSTYGPTKTNRKNYGIAREQFKHLRNKIKTLIDVDFAGLQKKLDAIDLPWTSGRPF